MLVFQAKAIQLKRWAVCGLVRLDHRLAAARVARDGVDGDRVIGWDQPRIDQRADQADPARGVAARIGDVLCLGDLVRLVGRHLGEAIDPIRIDPVRGAGIQHFRCGVAQGGRHSGGFLGGIVRQAKDDQVHFGHDVTPSGRITASIGRQALERDLWDCRQTLADAQARGAGFAVDKDRCHVS